MSCGEGCRCGLDPELLWLWHRLAATAPIRPLAWEPPCAKDEALQKVKRQKNKNENKQQQQKPLQLTVSAFELCLDHFIAIADLSYLVIHSPLFLSVLCFSFLLFLPSFGSLNVTSDCSRFFYIFDLTQPIFK